jgi:hypothetical protein
MLSTFAALSVNSAKHLCARRGRPFAARRVTRGWKQAKPERGEGDTGWQLKLVYVLYYKLKA